MRTEEEIRIKRIDLDNKRQELINDPDTRLLSRETKNEIYAEIGEQSILIWWFDWILGEVEERE